ncbi:transcriptional regulator [Streptococcus bovimastitidis]|uniref:Transcriptional regulator n=1 Tax=Streptococcus bovimastitidis TaxID=1856638 RepID=A0A1L8MP09_9STRE|nr:helix-turn-helix transcriptional regulator [Streptococcus bovimastitidis]OJF72482.1 transcriptional regulator [Streptococcus bovimastitidis]
MTNVSFDYFLKEELQNENFRQEFQTEKAILEIALAVSKARSNAGLSQRQLAELSHFPQSTIARIERGHNTSIETMSKIAVAVNQELKFILVKKLKKASWFI